MHGPAAGLRDEGALSALAAEHPELGPWLRPLGVAMGVLGAEPWRSLAPTLAQAAGAVEEAGAPLLHGATVPLPPRALHALAHALLAEALPGAPLDAIEPARLLQAAVAHDEEMIATLAGRAGVEASALAAAGELLAFPLLQACGRALEEARPRVWTRGWCPICGAWPALVEVRGLERARALRCARCGCGWSTEVLLCAFCGERDHQRLASLVPEGQEGQTRWAEACQTCHGYLKVVATLRGARPAAVILEDAASIHLDLAAVERGFGRPAGVGFPVRLQLSPNTVAA